MDLEALKRNERVQRRAARFDTHGNRRSKLSFFELLERLADPSLSIVDIARQADISRQAIDQLYERELQALVGGETIRERQKRITAEKHASYLRAAKGETIRHAPLRVIAEEARKAGFAVHGVPVVQSGGKGCYQSPRRLVINEALCQAHVVCAPTNVGALVNYTRFTLSQGCLRETQYQICLSQVDGYPTRIFIARNDMLTPLLQLSRDRYWQVYIPLEKRPPYKNSKQEIDWWRLENAWHLLKAPQP